MSIVTTRGNDKMATIHNNPKLEEPRMPLILDDNSARRWLEEPEAVLDHYEREDLHLNAWKVRKLRGRHYVGNTEEAWEECSYPELNDQQELF
jgi:putative SOS response-associated peptidase YedK